MRGEVRIIGGQWRGRKISVPNRIDLRPTPDRVRETLFNWLRTNISQANCLDCFAGTGVLGLEALSQGAKSVIFVEQNVQSVQSLKKNLEKLKVLNRAKVVHNDIFKWLTDKKFDSSFDLIFLDPPFDQNLFEKIFQKLVAVNAVDARTIIYFEDNKPLGQLPEGFQIIKKSKAGMVNFHLIQGI